MSTAEGFSEYIPSIAAFDPNTSEIRRFNILKADAGQFSHERNVNLGVAITEARRGIAACQVQGDSTSEEYLQYNSQFLSLSEELALGNLGLLFAVRKRLNEFHYNQSLHYDGLLVVGMEGLLNAARTYDPYYKDESAESIEDAGAFSTWAFPAIQHRMKAELPMLYSPYSIGMDGVSEFKRLEFARRWLIQTFGESPLFQDSVLLIALQDTLARDVYPTKDQFLQYKEAYKGSLLDTHDMNMIYRRIIEDENLVTVITRVQPIIEASTLSVADQSLDFESEYELKDEARRLMGLLLDERLRTIISLHYGLNGDEPLTLEQIGQLMGGLTRQRVQQLEEKAMALLQRESLIMSTNFSIDADNLEQVDHMPEDKLISIPLYEDMPEYVQSHPEVLNELQGVPAFMRKSRGMYISDTSISELLSRFLGIGRPRETAEDIAESCGLDAKYVGKVAKRHIRILYQWKLVDKGVWEDDVLAWGERIQEYQQMRSLLMNPPEYVVQLLDTPLFNLNFPPHVVTSFAKRLMSDPNALSYGLPKIRTLLGAYYGIGAKRRTTRSISNRLGYDSHLYVSTLKNAVLLLCNQHSQSQFPLALGYERLIPIAKKLERTRAVYALRDKFIVPEVAGPVYPIVQAMLSWGLQPSTVAEILNNQLSSANKYGAEPVKERAIADIDQETRGIRTRTKMWQVDRAESAALLLDKIATGKGMNRRAALVYDILSMINSGQSTEEVLQEYGFPRSEQLNFLLREAREEMEENSAVSNELLELYKRELGVPFLDNSVSHRKIINVFRQLLPLYAEHRRSLGDVIETGTFSAFSDREQRVLSLAASGKNNREIAQIVDAPSETYVGYNLDPHIKPTSATALTKDRQKIEAQEAYELLGVLIEDASLWAEFYQSDDELMRDTVLISYYVQGYNRQQIINLDDGWTPAEIRRSRDRIRNVVQNIKSGRSIVWKNRGNSSLSINP
jgi:DNA-directed RNA polymerase specialized sigma subunit